jgi:anti-sigma regulatory factor (Ser/Thr protein kinase)
MVTVAKDGIGSAAGVLGPVGRERMPQSERSATYARMRIECELEPTPEASSEARAVLRDLARDLDLTTYADLLTVVSELINNSVEHGPGKPVQLTVEVDPGGRVRGEVRDQGTGAITIRTCRPEERGLGLQIVDAAASRWGVHEGSTHVWFELEPDAKQ